MELAQYLICITARHEPAKDQHEMEHKMIWQKKKNGKSGSSKGKTTYANEQELLQSVIESIGPRPACLKKLSLPALGCLAYLFKAKMENDCFVEGHEIINKLVYDPEETITYLEGLGTLKTANWIHLSDPPAGVFTDQPPFCWMKSTIEFGETFHKQIGKAGVTSRQFSCNDSYLDAVFSYLQTLIREDNIAFKVRNPDIDLATSTPYNWYQAIARRIEVSTTPLPAAAIIKNFSLSIYQYLCLIGLLGQKEGDLDYDFNDTSDVVRLFALGRISRKKMKDHLFSEKSPLLQKKLVESTSGAFGERIQLTQLAMTSLLGKLDATTSTKELQARIKKQTIFDYDEPTVKKDSLLLPASVMESLRSLLFSETKLGQRIRKQWHASLPAAWGSPTGSTVLLYGPPGTGKTLTAQYLACELKLPLLKIDASKVLSCWVGESEQQVKRIFADYTMLQTQLGRSPLLLLNEADQLLGARGAGEHAVDKMHNNMQNLLLEGLERFTGILVATTNRRELLDEAFSRRFTYKLELPHPDKPLRIDLWKTHLPIKRLADDVDISQLADLGLSGGEIRLVVERAVRLAAFRGSTKLNHTTLHAIAQEELANRMKQSSLKQKIGF